jgi:NAD(P)-dependent dehydrogenase (short-subunit alcohol dehydrogenase family)
MSSRPVTIVSGIGFGLGVSLANQFAAAGYDVLGLARSSRVAHEAAAAAETAGGTYWHRVCDITQTEQVRTAIGPMLGRVQVLVHAAHELLIKPFRETEVLEFETVWRSSCYGSMIVSHEVVPGMVARGDGTIIFSGATAGLRGGAGFAAFASAKFAVRGLSQALARELGPQGIHVAHVVLDGLIDEPQTNERFGPPKSSRMNPDEIAAAYLALVRQDRSAWSQEIDLRPSSE